jgi:YD repeat-containing protein
MATPILNQSIIQSSVTTDADIRFELNKIRTAYPNAFVTTYTYKPLVGMTSATDANNHTIYYEYDEFGRLIIIKDQNGKILKKYCYNYAGQQGACTFYESAAINDYYYSQSCGGQSPVPYYVTIPQGMFTSTASQPDADQQARQYAQAQANQYGTCQAPNTTLYYNNYDGTDFYIDVYNIDTGEEFWFEAHSFSNGVLGDVPAGTYNISITSFDYYVYYSYSVGCGYYSSGSNAASFFSVPLNSGCNSFQMY